MRVILRHPETGRDVAVDDWHVEYWEKLGYRALTPTPAAEEPAKVPKRKKLTKKSTG